MKYDVIIVGAGSMGMAAGYFLSKQGKQVLLIDSFDPPHHMGSHHGDTRIIRKAYGEGEHYVQLALLAEKLWYDLEQQTGRNLFYQTGVLNVGSFNSPFIKNVISSSEKYSLELEVLNANEIVKRWPGFTIPHNHIGCFESTSGVLKSEECIKAYRQLAISNGATLLVNQKVKQIFNKNNIVSVQTNDNTYYADQLIISAGAWSSKLLSLIGLELPLTTTRKTISWFDVDESLFSDSHFPAFLFDVPEGLYYGFPSFNGTGLKLGIHEGGEVIDPDYLIKEYGELDKRDLSIFLQKYTTISPITVRDGKVCKYTLTPDEDFIIDLHPDYPNIVIATGFSGHGFKFASAVGQILSDLISSGQSNYDLAPFSLNRFLY